MFKVGQTVWCVCRGNGVVIDIYDDNNDIELSSYLIKYPISVLFKDYNPSKHFRYTIDGSMVEGQNRTLFFSEPKIVALTEPPFTPTFVKGDIVVINQWSYESNVISIVSEETEKSLFLYDVEPLNKKSLFDCDTYKITKNDYSIKKIGAFTQAD